MSLDEFLASSRDFHNTADFDFRAGTMGFTAWSKVSMRMPPTAITPPTLSMMPVALAVFRLRIIIQIVTGQARHGKGGAPSGPIQLERDAADDPANLAALHGAIERGVTHFDTAEMYGGGHSEELLGEAIKGVDRSSLLVVSKVRAENQRPDDLRSAFERSCERIGTDYLDVYMLHSFNGDVPLDETLGAVDDLIDEGRVRRSAVANFNVERMELACKATRHRIVANQVNYNVQVREAEHAGLVDWCASNEVALIAWGPVQKGEIDITAPILRELADRYAATPIQVALNWVTSQKSVVAVSKTRGMAHLDENLAALSWTMSDDDIERVRREMPGQLDVSDRVPLNN